MYDRIVRAKVSQNCEAAALDYYNLACDALLQDSEDSVDLLRPIYYLGLTDATQIYAYIQTFASVAFTEWLGEKRQLLEHCFAVLEICCRMGDSTAQKAGIKNLFPGLTISETELKRIVEEEFI